MKLIYESMDFEQAKELALCRTWVGLAQPVEGQIEPKCDVPRAGRNPAPTGLQA